MMQKQEQSDRNAACIYPQSYLETLEDHLKKEKTINNVFFSMLEKQRNPMSFALDLCYYSKQKNPRKGKSNKLPNVILESLKEWCKNRDISHLLTKRLKLDALNKSLAFSSNICVKLVCEIFRLEEEKEHVICFINGLLSERKLSMAYFYISALDLESEFPLEALVFPLLFLGHETYVKAYLNKVPHLQNHFIKTLDNLCRSGFVLRNFLDSLDIESIKPKNMIIDVKWLSKKFPAFIEYFNIDIRNCPVLYKTRVSGAMAYLCRRMYVEESIDYEAFEEMMFDTLKDHFDIQRSLLVKLISINEAATAFRFAELFQINKNDWPVALKNIPYPDAVSSTVRLKPIPDIYVDYLFLRLNRSDIHLVDTPEKLIEAVDDISENYNMVGLDCEWKPSLGIYKQKTALCQLAVWDSVYLLDIVTLNEYQSKQIWEYLLRKIFYNEEITKLGYGGLYDINILIQTVGCEKANDERYRNVVDLLSFFKKLKTHYPEISEEIESWHTTLPGDDQKGLSQLCRTVLGRPLDKADQFSNWEKRPLRERQVYYAALDAFCLLMIYEKIYPVLKKHELDLTKVLETKQTPFKAQKPDTVAQSTPLNQPLSVKDFKVVIDNTVGGITKYLRLLGADVVALKEGDDHMLAVQIAQTQKRIIITAGAAFRKLSGYVPPNMCFCVDNAITARQQVAQIIEHFKVQCQDSDIFSRCTMCNASNYIHVQSDELLSAWTEFVGFSADMKSIGKKNNSVYQCDITDVDGHVHENIPIQLAAFTPQVFERVEHFLLCSGCGKVYWEGSHLLRLKKSLSTYVDVKNGDNSVYKEKSDSEVPVGDKEQNINDIPVSKEDDVQLVGSSVQSSVLQFEVDDSEEENDIDDMHFG